MKGWMKAEPEVKIVEDAESRAEWMIQQAREEAADIVQKARKEAGYITQAGEEALHLAFRILSSNSRFTFTGIRSAVEVVDSIEAF